MVSLESSPPQFKRNPPITITAFMLMADTSDRFSLSEMLWRLVETLQVIVIGASGDTRYAQKQCQGIFMP